MVPYPSYTTNMVNIHKGGLLPYYVLTQQMEPVSQKREFLQNVTVCKGTIPTVFMKTVKNVIPNVYHAHFNPINVPYVLILKTKVLHPPAPAFKDTIKTQKTKTVKVYIHKIYIIFIQY